MTNHPSLSETKRFPRMHPAAKTKAVPAQANQRVDHLSSVPDTRKRQNKGFEMGACLAVQGAKAKQ